MKTQKSTTAAKEESVQPTSPPNPIKKQLWLHIGFPKTGTTSIQSVLCQASDHLITRGHWYPRLAGFKNRQRIAHSHHSLFRALTLPGTTDSVDQRRIADADLTAVLDRFNNDDALQQLIISHEGLLENVALDFE